MSETPAPEITIDAKTYRYASTLKSDFFSVNYLYEREGAAHVLKISRLAQHFDAVSLEQPAIGRHAEESGCQSSLQQPWLTD